MRRIPPKATLETIARAVLPKPNAAYRSSAPGAVVECWCLMVATMDRRALDRFTRDIWKRFDHGDVGPPRDAILRRRRRTNVSACSRPHDSPGSPVDLTQRN